MKLSINEERNSLKNIFINKQANKLALIHKEDKKA
jgi:hypothetical protein